MLGLILLATGLIGFGLASYWDLRTTEFPDWLPYSIITTALVIRGIFSWMMNDITILSSSILVGLVFLGFGMLLYLSKQWGDGDAWLLGALGFLFPDTKGLEFTPNIGFSVLAHTIPFPLIVLFNFFFIAFLFLIVYSVALGIKSPKMSRKFFRELKKDIKRILGLIAFVTAGFLFTFLYLSSALRVPATSLYYILIMPPVFVFLIFFLHYGRFVEDNLFRKKIPVKNLKPGDVLVNDRWRGLTKKEVNALKRKGGYVWIKEGVRFAPVFMITMLVTLFYGNLVLIFV